MPFAHSWSLGEPQMGTPEWTLVMNQNSSGTCPVHTRSAAMFTNIHMPFSCLGSSDWISRWSINHVTVELRVPVLTCRILRNGFQSDSRVWWVSSQGVGRMSSILPLSPQVSHCEAANFIYLDHIPESHALMIKLLEEIRACLPLHSRLLI